MIDRQFLSDNGCFEFADPITGYKICVHHTTLDAQPNTSKIVVAMHGLDRAAAHFRDVLREPARRSGQLVLVPEFDHSQFPDVHDYNYGGVRKSPPHNDVLPQDRWNFGLIDRLFEYVRTAIGSERSTFGMFGNSAGAQFVLRYLALTKSRRVSVAVAANSGWVHVA